MVKGEEIMQFQFVGEGQQPKNCIELIRHNDGVYRLPPSKEIIHKQLKDFVPSSDTIAHISISPEDRKLYSVNTPNFDKLVDNHPVYITDVKYRATDHIAPLNEDEVIVCMLALDGKKQFLMLNRKWIVPYVNKPLIQN